MVNPRWFEIDKNNVASFQDAKPSMNKTKIRSFLDFCNVNRRFIDDFTEIVHPLNKLIKMEHMTTSGSATRKGIHCSRRTRMVNENKLGFHLVRSSSPRRSIPHRSRNPLLSFVLWILYSRTSCMRSLTSTRKMHRYIVFSHLTTAVADISVSYFATQKLNSKSNKKITKRIRKPMPYRFWNPWVKLLLMMTATEFRLYPRRD